MEEQKRVKDGVVNGQGEKGGKGVPRPHTGQTHSPSQLAWSESRWLPRVIFV